MNKLKPPEDTLFTVAEVAARLRVCDETIRRYIRSRHVAALKLGRKWLIPASEVARIEREARVCEAAAFELAKGPYGKPIGSCPPITPAAVLAIGKSTNGT